MREKSAVKIECPECDFKFWSMHGLHWHLRKEHGMTEDEAYDAAGEAYADAIESWAESNSSPYGH